MRRVLLLVALLAGASSAPAFAQVKTIGITNPKRYVIDLPKTVEMYQTVFGMKIVNPPGDFGTNDAGQRAMGTVGSKYRTALFELTGIPLRLQLSQFAGLDGHPLGERTRADIGDQVLVFTVRDLAAPMAAAKTAGLKITTVGGQPITRKTATGTVRTITYRDMDGHPFELNQPTPLPQVDPAITGNIIAAAVEVSVDDLDKTVALLRNGLGFELSAPTDFTRDEAYMKAIGIESAANHPQRRSVAVNLDGKSLGLSYVEYKGIQKQRQTFRHLDAGSSGMDISVTDAVAVLKAVKEAGGTILGESPVMGANGAVTAVVRMPYNTLFSIAQRGSGPGPGGQGAPAGGAPPAPPRQ